MIKVLKTDIYYYDSPAPGSVECFCSRCGGLIKTEENPVRLNPQRPGDHGYTKHRNGLVEFRYCQACSAINYPVYRKHYNGIEFVKVVSANQVVSIYRGVYGFKLLMSSNRITATEAMDNSRYMPSSDKEFEMAIRDAIQNLNKLHTIA